MRRRLREILHRWNFEPPNEAITLLEAMLVQDPDQRPSALDIAHSPFLRPVRHLWDAHIGSYNFVRRRHYLMFLQQWGLIEGVQEVQVSVQQAVLGNSDLQRYIASFL
jgi:hypothetical protein